MIRDALKSLLTRMQEVATTEEDDLIAFLDSPRALDLARLMAADLKALDVGVTGKDYLRGAEEDAQRILEALSGECSHYEAYLSDGGYSRFVIHWPYETMVAYGDVVVHTDPVLMSEKAKARWDAEGLPYVVKLKDFAGGTS